MIKKIICDIFTEPGATNHLVCPARCIAVLGSLTFLALGAAHYIQHHVFDAQQFALGFGTIMGGIGVALGLKKDSPKEDPKE